MARQPMPSPAAPLVVPDDGTITDAWLQFLGLLYARSGGAMGTALLPGLHNAANDAAAATAGVPVTGVYRNGSVLMVRVV